MRELTQTGERPWRSCLLPQWAEIRPEAGFQRLCHNDDVTRSDILSECVANAAIRAA